jgi:hypothetical protein
MAQQVAQLADTEKDLGSNPSEPTIMRDRVTVTREAHILKLGVQLPLPQPRGYSSNVEQLTVNQLVGSSSLSIPSNVL